MCNIQFLLFVFNMQISPVKQGQLGREIYAEYTAGGRKTGMVALVSYAWITSSGIMN